MRRVIMPLPSRDFEPTEVAVPWRRLRDAGVEVAFATPDGHPCRCDPLALEGVLFGTIGAKPRDAETYRELAADPAFAAPMNYAAIDVEHFAGLHLAGGHAAGMRPYLESETLQAKAATFMANHKLISAICHGPIVLARAHSQATRQSILRGRRMTALTKPLERTAYWLTRWTLGKHFRTYPTYVEDECIAAIGNQGRFERGPLIPAYANPFVVCDGALLTARWPGDARALADALVHELLTGRGSDRTPASERVQPPGR